MNYRPDFVELSAGVTLSTALRYLLFAGLAWMLAYRWFLPRWHHRKIIPALPEKSDIRREVIHSFQSILVFGVVGTTTLLASFQGWTRMYFEISQRGWIWFWASIGITILIHDAYFYWTHRWMHHPALFGWMHRTHHLSKNPTPWAAFAFSPWEALVQAGIFPLVTLLLPIHPLAFAAFMLWQLTFNVLGHTGFEFHPRWLMRTPLRLLLNTPTNHIQHHERLNGNYGIYFNFWDRLMQTNHPEYESRFNGVTHRTPTPKV